MNRRLGDVVGAKLLLATDSCVLDFKIPATFDAMTLKKTSVRSLLSRARKAVSSHHKPSPPTQQAAKGNDGLAGVFKGIFKQNRHDGVRTANEGHSEQNSTSAFKLRRIVTVYTAKAKQVRIP